MTEDHHGDEELFLALISHWVKAHQGLVKLLQELPVPIQVPTTLGADEEVMAMVLDAMGNAAEIVHDQPVDPHVSGIIAQAILFWLAAYDVTAGYEERRKPWTLAAAHMLIQQCVVMTVLALTHLLGLDPE